MVDTAVPGSALRQGRACFEQQAWREAHTYLSKADHESRLAPDDVERLATASYLVGNETESAHLWERAHHDYQARGDTEAAARCASRVGFALAFNGQLALGNGWLARARRLLDDAGIDSAVRGYLLIPDAIRLCRGPEPTRGYDLFSEVVAIGQRLRDRDLVTLARQGQGRALLRMGRPAEGTALLDEVMVAVTSGELSPLFVGDVYCSVIDGCSEIFDLRRAHEWTAALARWCEGQPDAIPYRGTCLLRRAEILQLHGSWTDAMGETQRACERLLMPPPKPAAGLACYQRAELHRLRGDFAQAEEAYRHASELGRRPQPGLALLRLAQGDVDAALASIRRAVDETREPIGRSRLLGAYAEIQLAAGDVTSARAAVTELREIAAAFATPFLQATAAHGLGAVLIAEGKADEALAALREACPLWRELEAPYEDARCRVLIGVASRMVGDVDTSALELDAARRTFHRLGAATDGARVDELTAPSVAAGSSRLTGRELEVLGLVASGKTNRAIADALGLSEKTVARHVSNIFVKLGLSSRAAATAFAYRNRLV